MLRPRQNRSFWIHSAGDFFSSFKRLIKTFIRIFIGITIRIVIKTFIRAAEEKKDGFPNRERKSIGRIFRGSGFRQKKQRKTGRGTKQKEA